MTLPRLLPSGARPSHAPLPALGLALPLLAACAPPGEEDPLAGLTLVGEDVSDAAVEGLTDAQVERFREGDAAFEHSFRESQGLGPAYIRTRCSACHEDDARGPGEVLKMVMVEADGVTPAADQSALPWGHTTRPYVAGGAETPILPPEGVEGLLVSVRVGPPVFGRGYLEAADDAAIEALAAEGRGGTTGRVHRVAWDFAVEADPALFDHAPGDEGLIGRFGHKARVATLDGFAADAYQGDMSITSPYRPEELDNPDGLGDDQLVGPDLDLDTIRAVGDYTRMLAIPARTLPDNGGEALFEEVGCADCHVATLPTRADHPVAALAGVDAPVYTDLLLHDMGPALADGLEDDGGGEAAGPAEWRTAPLIGLRFARSLLHDGRAADVAAAIAAHGDPASESAPSHTRFAELSPEDQAALVAWVEAL